MVLALNMKMTPISTSNPAPSFRIMTPNFSQKNTTIRVAFAAFVSFFAPAVFLGLLWWFFEARWETNDDVGMSMIAHGYGIASQGSAHLLYSNVLWGHIVRLIPPFGGLLGYSIATMTAFYAFGVAVIFFLMRLQIGALVAVAAIVLVLLQPALLPQFTVLAGLLAAAAILGLIAYDRSDCVACLVIASVLFFFAFLIRNHEAALVLIVAAPLLPWRRIKDRRIWPIAGALIVLLVAATVYDTASYRGEEWALFRDLNYARAPFTDFGASQVVLQRPDVMEKFGLSANDIRLIANWFLVDRKLADPTTLNELLKEVGFFSTSAFDGALAQAALRQLAGPYLVALMTVAMGLVLLAFRARLLAALLLAVLLVAFLGAIGRPGVTRVFVPLISMVVLVGPAFVPWQVRWRSIASGVLVGFGSAASVWLIWPDVQSSEAAIARLRAERFVAREPIVSWGSSMPLQFMFPLFTTTRDIMDTKMIALGVSTQAPFAVSRQLDLAGRGMIDQLLSPDGVPIYATAEYMDMLSIYCSERHRGTLESHTLSISIYGTLWQAKCLVSGKAKS